jgi:class 3 adenylate cyclase
MALNDDLSIQVKEIFASPATPREGRVVPAPETVQFGEDAVYLKKATVLYADISGSTKLVDGYKWWFAAEIYKSFLYCAARIIRSEDGEITAYDGDRIMAIFLGDTQATNAVKAGLRINASVVNIINPAIKNRYPTEYQLKHVVGIDTSSVTASKIGIRGGNDLVWIGKAANHAAKLTELDQGPITWITKTVFDDLLNNVKFSPTTGELIWTSWTWNAMGGLPIYGSTWWYQV